MKIFDLSHRLNSNTPVYPGTIPPKISDTALIETDGYREKLLSIQSHLGTHIDAPAHMIKNGKCLDELSLLKFTGNALIISIPKNTQLILKEHILPFGPKILENDFVLFRTGWDTLWGTENYFSGFPVLGAEAAQWLTGFELKGVGFDCISADPIGTYQYPNHFAFLEKEIILIENLIFPTNLTENKGYFSCFPLPIEKADGSPVRAILITE